MIVPASVAASWNYSETPAEIEAKARETVNNYRDAVRACRFYQSPSKTLPEVLASAERAAEKELLRWVIRGITNG